jgi:DNA end-binding protein Ku
MVKKAATLSNDSKEAQIAALTAQLAGGAAATSAPVATGDFTKKAASRATNNLMVSMGLLSFPVKVYKATDTDTVSFNQLHSECHSKLKQQEMVCPVCSAEATAKAVAEAVKKGKDPSTVAEVKVTCSKDQIVKGFEYEKDKFATFTQEEIDGCKVAADDSLEITEFVEESTIDPIFYESSYFVGPDKGAEMQFALLSAGMKAQYDEKGKLTRTARVAIGRVALKGREQTVVIRPYGDSGLIMNYIYFDYEVRSFAGWDKVPNADALSPKFLAVANQLVDMMTEKFAPETKSDSYLINARKLISAKAAGLTAPVIVKAAAKDASADLEAALEASLNAAKIKRASKKAA